jgi:hypothetical protein
MLQRYTLNVTVGTPPQLVSVLVDTGSSDIWVPAPNSSGCSPSCPPGGFDTTKSSTYKPTGITFNATYGLTPDNIILGQYFRDTVSIGSATIPNMTLAIANVPSSLFFDGFWGILGLGARLGESTFLNLASPLFGNPNGTFPTIYDQLQSHGYTARRAFSMWLNSISATTGRIIFGGIDKTKYHGDLVSVPVELTHGFFFNWAVALTSVARCTDSDGATKKEVLVPSNSSTTVILDSGSPNIYLPWALAQDIGLAMNASTHFGTPYVPCAFRTDSSTLEFGFNGPSGEPKITVPYSALIYPFSYPASIGSVTAPDGSELCYLGVIGTNGTIFLLGDTFIRSAYMVYDVDNLQVAMAQAKYDIDEEDVMAIPAGDGIAGVMTSFRSR